MADRKIGGSGIGSCLEEPPIAIDPTSNTDQVVGQDLRQKIPKNLDGAARRIGRRRQTDFEPNFGIAAGHAQATLQPSLDKQIFGNGWGGGDRAIRENPVEQGTQIGH